MPVWIVAVLLLAVLACPISMWVMGKVMRRQVSCPMCRVGTGEEHHHSLDAQVARRTAVEQEIAEVKAEIGQNFKSDRTAAKAGEG